MMGTGCLSADTGLAGYPKAMKPGMSGTKTLRPVRSFWLRFTEREGPGSIGRPIAGDICAKGAASARKSKILPADQTLEKASRYCAPPPGRARTAAIGRCSATSLGLRRYTEVAALRS